MKSKQLVILVTATLVLSTFSHAQINFRPELLGGISVNTLTTGVFSNWGDGWIIGGGAAYPISSLIDLALNVTYSRYPYRGDNLQLVFPTVAGLRWSVSGDPSNVVEAALASRFNTSRQTAHNTANNDTRFFDKSMLKLGKKISCARSTVLLTMNLLFDSSQNGGVVCRDVTMCAERSYTMKRTDYVQAYAVDGRRFGGGWL